MGAEESSLAHSLEYEVRASGLSQLQRVGVEKLRGLLMVWLQRHGPPDFRSYRSMGDRNLRHGKDDGGQEGKRSKQEHRHRQEGEEEGVQIDRQTDRHHAEQKQDDRDVEHQTRLLERGIAIRQLNQLLVDQAQAIAIRMVLGVISVENVYSLPRHAAEAITDLQVAPQGQVQKDDAARQHHGRSNDELNGLGNTVGVHAAVSGMEAERDGAVSCS